MRSGISVSCPVCQSLDTFAFLVRDSVPVHQNAPARSAGEARKARRGRLEMRVCPQCGFVFNGAFDPSLLSYDETYDNTQTCSPEFERYMQERVEHLVVDHGLQNQVIVEVGCGKGDFLRRLAEFPGANLRCIGFDPTYVGPESLADGRLQFIQRFYDEAAAAIAADAVVCRHVIEHIADPRAMLSAVRGAVNRSGHALVCFETPCVEWILRNRVVWDFFYEHCSLFTAASLTSTFTRAGFEVSSVSHVFGGQYLWIECRPGHDVSARDEPGEVPALARAIGRNEMALRARWVDLLKTASPGGRSGVVVWGAGAKGVTFANLMDPDAARIDCFVDVNPRKQGMYVAGTGHPIVGPDTALANGASTILVLNPNYTVEIENYLHAARSTARVVDLMNANQ